MDQDDGELSPAGRHTFILLLIINFLVLANIIAAIRWVLLRL